MRNTPSSDDRLKLRDPWRGLLPLSSGHNIPPQKPTPIIARPQIDFEPGRLLIKDADHWHVNQIFAGDRRDRCVPAPGEVFDKKVGWHPVALGRINAGDDFLLEVTYVGPSESGAALEACVFGVQDCMLQESHSEAVTESGDNMTSVKARSMPSTLPSMSVKLRIPPRKSGFCPDALIIENAANWIVNDVLVRGRSVFLQSGDVPGEMFTGASNGRLRLGHLAPEDEFAIVATYIGTIEGGEPLAYSLSGPSWSPRKSTDCEVILPLSCGVNIQPRQWARITARAQLGDSRSKAYLSLSPSERFIARRIVIANASNFIINDLKIGNSSQFLQSGDVPGTAFAADAVYNSIALRPLAPGVDFEICATNAGELPAPFYCGVAGNIIQL